MTSKAIGIIAGVGAAAFVGYCFYFDHKRRSAPNFKEMLKEKRRIAAIEKTKSSSPNLPNFNDQEAVQQFFLKGVQKGEMLLAQGNIEEGVEQLSLAVAVCGQPRSLLNVLQQTLAPEIYILLLKKLDVAQMQVRAHIASTIPGILTSPQRFEEESLD